MSLCCSTKSLVKSGCSDSGSWYRPHPYGVYPRGNARRVEDIVERFGTLSGLVRLRSAKQEDDHAEQAYLDVVQNILSFLEVPDLCELSATCSAWYVMVHCTDAFRSAYQALSPTYMNYHGSWKESAIRAYLAEASRSASAALAPSSAALTTTSKRKTMEEEEKLTAAASPRRKRSRDNAEGNQGGMDNGSYAEMARLGEGATRVSATEVHRRRCFTGCDVGTMTVLSHTPVPVSRAYYCDQMFQAWMCTLLPPHHLLRRVPSDEVPRLLKETQNRNAAPHAPQYASRLRPVDRRQGLSVEEFVREYEAKRVPVILTDVATEWPVFRLLQGEFKNLSLRRKSLVREGRSEAPLRCEFTEMNIEDYVRYATEQRDERPIYMFDAEFASVFDVERLFTVPEHFARDDFFRVLGEAERPKYRWIIAGPARGGSSFHVDPNYTHAWNANLTGRKRWLFFPPSSPPPGVVPSADMSEVATPVSLTEWVLNYYEESVRQLHQVGYECVCEPGDVMFVPCGWWHSVINLEDSVAITQNYVSRTNLFDVLKFLRAMKNSISGVNEDAATASAEETQQRRAALGAQFSRAMQAAHPVLMSEMVQREEREREERERRRFTAVELLPKDADGFQFDF